MHDQTKEHKLCRVYRREHFNCDESLTSKRRNFYKIAMVTKGSGLLLYGDQSLHISPKSMLFLNPNIAYAWQAETKEQSGYFLTFDAELLSHNRRKNLLNAHPFQSDTSPVYSCTSNAQELLSFFFEQLLVEQEIKQTYNETVIQNYVELIIHQGINASPLSELEINSTSTRISSDFLNLLAQQFNGQYNHFTAQDYANKLSIHVNHLNRLLKNVTGKTTQQHLIERKVLEAKTQLSQSNKRISEIAYELGFNHPSSFNHFFNKHQSISPKLFRHAHV